MNQTVGLLAGLIGGMFGLAASIIVMFVLEAGTLTTWLGMAFSILAMIGAVLVRKKRKVGSILLLVAGIGVFLTVPLFHIMAAILIIIAGVIGLMQEETTSDLP